MIVLSWHGTTLYARFWALRTGVSSWTSKFGRYMCAYVHWNDIMLFSIGLPGGIAKRRWHLTLWTWRIKS